MNSLLIQTIRDLIESLIGYYPGKPMREAHTEG